MTSPTRSLTPSAPALGVGVQAAPTYSPITAEVLARAARPDFGAWLGHIRAAAGCTRPIRLTGSAAALDKTTGTVLSQIDTAAMPDGTIYKGCGNRRAAVCPSCAETYRRDAYQILRAGLAGGKSVPESVGTHPAAFVTFTAPSFGPVHGRVVKEHTCTDRRRCDCRPDPCHARPREPECAHGVPAACFARHEQGDARLGQPICLDCYDHAHQVVWNLFAGELWRRTKQAAERWLGKGVRISHGKAAEFQTRGVIHFHALLRLDGHDPDHPDEILPPPTWATASDLEDAIRHAVTHTAFTTPAHPAHLDAGGNPTGWPITWGDPDKGLDIRPITMRGGEVTDQQAAGYLAKYATKSTEATGHNSTRITADTIDMWADPDGDHTARILDACWRLGAPVITPVDGQPLGPLRSCDDCGHRTRLQYCRRCGFIPDPTDPGSDTYVSTPVPTSYHRLRRWAHMLGFGGHFLTKARRYSVTFKILREARATWRRNHNDDQADGTISAAEHLDEETTLIVGGLTFAGAGWHTNGDALLANTAAAKAREYAATAREELAHEVGSQLVDDIAKAA